jgi:putative transposase
MANEPKSKTKITADLLDELLGGEDPKEAFLNGGLIDDLKKAIAERALNAEMDVHLEQDEEQASGNHRNGNTRKRVLPDTGAMEVSIPRDRHGRFDPQLIEKYRRRLPGFEEKVIGLYARGMSIREIQAHVRELYGVDVSPELVSKVTDAVHDEVREWQSRPLDSVYAIVYFDAVRVKIRDEGLVRNKAVYLAIGVTCSGYKEVLGLWIEQTEGAKFWLSVMNELKSRGVTDVLIAVVDGLKGFPEAIEAAFPDALVQTCIVHLIHHSMAYGSWKERKAIGAALKAIYQAESADAATAALEAFEAGEWGRKYPAIVQSWRRNVAQKWKRPPQFWSQARSEFAIRFGERFMMVSE